MNYCNLDLWRIHVFSEDDNAMQRQENCKAEESKKRFFNEKKKKTKSRESQTKFNENELHFKVESKQVK